MKKLSKGFALSLMHLALGVAGCATVPGSARLGSRDVPGSQQQSIARIYERQGKFGKAKTEYDEILRKNPNAFEVHQRLAIIEAKLGNTQEAERHFAIALRGRPNDAELLTDYAYLLYGEDKLDQSEKLNREALKLEPENKRAQNNLALVVGAQGKYDESYALWLNSVGEAKAHANLAYLYTRAGDMKRAQQHYSRSLSLDGDLKQSSQALVQLHQQQNRANLAARNKSQETLTAAHSNPQNKNATKGAAPAEGVVQASTAGAAQGNQIPAVNETFEIVDPGTPPADGPPPAIGSLEPGEEAIASNSGATQHSTEIAALTQPERQLPQAEEAIIPEVSAAGSSPRTVPEPAAQVAAEAATEAPAIAEISAPAPVTAGSSATEEAKAAAAQAKVQELMAMLGSDNAELRKSAIRRLGKMGTTATSAGPACAKLLDDRNPYVRVRAALTHWQITRDPHLAVRTLTSALREEDPGVRSLAAAAVGEIGPEAKDAMLALKPTLHDPDVLVRVYAAEAYCKIEPNRQPAIQVLTNALNDETPMVRETAAYAIAQVGAESPAAILALAALVDDQESNVRGAAVYALGEIGPPAAAAIPNLKKAQSDADEQVRTAAGMAIRRIESLTAK